MSMNEAIDVRRTVQRAGVKTVISHQHRYGQHYQKVAELIRVGAIGRVLTVYAHFFHHHAALVSRNVK